MCTEQKTHSSPLLSLSECASSYFHWKINNEIPSKKRFDTNMNRLHGASDLWVITRSKLIQLMSIRTRFIQWNFNTVYYYSLSCSLADKAYTCFDKFFRWQTYRRAISQPQVPQHVCIRSQNGFLNSKCHKTSHFVSHAHDLREAVASAQHHLKIVSTGSCIDHSIR